MTQARAIKAAQQIARRWDLRDSSLFAETHRAYVFRVMAPEGPAALKLYKHWGWSGEGASIPFLHDLQPGVGVRIYRKNTVWAAMLLEWLEGPTLAEMAARGNLAKAFDLFGEVAAGINASTFRHPFIYQSLAKRWRTGLRKKIATTTDPAIKSELLRAAQLLEKLIASTTATHIIHGDLVLANVINTSDGPRLIDPKALRADPAMEFAKQLSRTAKGLPPGVMTAPVSDQCARLAQKTGLSSERIAGWAAVQLTLLLPTGGAMDDATRQHLAVAGALLDDLDI